VALLPIIFCGQLLLSRWTAIWTVFTLLYLAVAVWALRNLLKSLNFKSWKPPYPPRQKSQSLRVRLNPRDSERTNFFLIDSPPPPPLAQKIAYKLAKGQEEFTRIKMRTYLSCSLSLSCSLFLSHLHSLTSFKCVVCLRVARTNE
jgi:hypothetical protein